MVREDAIYARQSVDRIDSISIESQIEYCKYETRGEPFRVYQDKGYSGKNIQRPEFQEMLAAVRRGEIKRVICYKLDRCSRSILDFANMMEEFQRHQVEFVSCTEKFDTSTPMGRAMLNICIVFAQLERETIQQRVTDAYRSRSQRGFYMGGRIPYGFRLEPFLLQGKKTSRYAVCTEEAEVIRQIYTRYANPQVSVGDIVKFLWENGIPNSRTKDGCWSKSYIVSILKNPIYVKADLDIYHFFKEQGSNVLNDPGDFAGQNGCYLFSDTGKARKTLRLEGHTLVLAPHEGIIPSDIWLQCRRKCLNHPQAAKPIKAINTWLAGKIKCGRCGYALVIRKWNQNRYYMCSRHLNQKAACEGVGGLHADEVEAAVLDAIREKIAVLGPLSPPAAGQTDPKLGTLKIKAALCQNEIDLYLSKLRTANDAVADYINKKVAELDAQKQTCQREIAELENRVPRGADRPRVIQNGMACWDQLSNSEKMTVVDTLVGSITATKTHMTIRWKL